MSDDPWNDPQAQDWLHHVKTHVLPMVEDSTMVISICPPADKVDIKFSVELGLSIMLDKPIIAVVRPGQEVPAKLAQVADRVFVGDITTPRGRARFMEMLQRFRDE